MNAPRCVWCHHPVTPEVVMGKLLWPVICARCVGKCSPPAPSPRPPRKEYQRDFTTPPPRGTARCGRCGLLCPEGTELCLLCDAEARGQHLRTSDVEAYLALAVRIGRAA